MVAWFWWILLCLYNCFVSFCFVCLFVMKLPLICVLPCSPVASSLVPLRQTEPDPACLRSLATSSSVDENSNSPSVFSTPKRPCHLHLTSPLLPRRVSDPSDPLYLSEGEEAPPSPTSLSYPSPIASDFELSVLERFDQLMASLGSFSAHSGLFLAHKFHVLTSSKTWLMLLRFTYFYYII